jgi:hypothetical protein
VEIALTQWNKDGSQVRPQNWAHERDVKKVLTQIRNAKHEGGVKDDGRNEEKISNSKVSAQGQALTSIGTHTQSSDNFNSRDAKRKRAELRQRAERILTHAWTLWHLEPSLLPIPIDEATRRRAMTLPFSQMWKVFRVNEWPTDLVI